MSSSQWPFLPKWPFLCRHSKIIWRRDRWVFNFSACLKTEHCLRAACFLCVVDKPASHRISKDRGWYCGIVIRVLQCWRYYDWRRCHRHRPNYFLGKEGSRYALRLQLAKLFELTIWLIFIDKKIAANQHKPCSPGAGSNHSGKWKGSAARMLWYICC